MHLETSTNPELRTLGRTLLPRIVRPGTAPGVDLVPGELAVTFVVDGPEGTRPIEDGDLARWSVSSEALAPLALENLRQRSPADAWYQLRAVPGMLVYLAGDAHAAARMMLIREIVKPWPLGGVLVSVPTPDQLLCVPLDTLENLATVQVLVQSCHLAHSLGSDPVTDQVFWHDGRQWAHLQVTHKDDSVEVLPPPGFLKMVEKLAALKLTNQAGEA